jgi:DnaJ-class molecular chaperone
MEKPNPDANKCPACRGRGWKFQRSRRAAVIGTLTRGSTAAMRRSCLECGGTGRLDRGVVTPADDSGN